jgi:hypothetical protein
MGKDKFVFRRPADRRVWHVYATKGGLQAQSLCGFRSVQLVDETSEPPESQRDRCRSCEGELEKLLAAEQASA